MLMILGLIVAALFVFIGVSLIPGAHTAAQTTTPTDSSGVAGWWEGVIMIVFVSTIIYGVVRQISVTTSDSRDKGTSDAPNIVVQYMYTYIKEHKKLVIVGVSFASLVFLLWLLPLIL